ncbi:tissue factor-like [Symphorus nematophorus]
MAALKTVFYLGVCLSAVIITTADIVPKPPKAENVHWVSQDFKTILTWTARHSDHTYSVLYSENDRDWKETPDCIQASDSCDLTPVLEPINRDYYADIKTEPSSPDYDYDLEELPHTFSPPFNPYKQSNISAVSFTVEAVDENTVVLNITDPLSAIHQHAKQLSIRDIFKKDLKYKISYYKAGSTGKRDNISDSSIAQVSGLDAGHSYCFVVAAFIPSRPPNSQYGAWSEQRCSQGQTDVIQELSFGAWVGIIFILLTVLIIFITVTVLCCRCCRQRNKSHQTSQQSSTPI